MPEAAPTIARDVKFLKYLLIALAFGIPISISLAEPLAFAAMVVWLVTLRHQEIRRAVRQNPLLIPLSAFIIVAVAVSLIWGARPARSVDKFHRLTLLLLAFAVPAGVMRATVDCTLAKTRSLLLAFIVGSTLLGLHDIIRVPWHALSGNNLYDAGNMRDPQFYMVGLCLLVALWISGIERQRLWLWCVALVANLSGLVLHFKRGVWMAFFAALVLLVVRARRWKILIPAVVCVAGVLLVPQVRDRIAHLKEVVSAKTGGRYVLWTETAPSLYEAYPMGMGWCAVTHEDFVEHSEHFVQEKLNHLHNNFLQMRLELGLAGSAVWCLMMLTVLVLLFRAGGFGVNGGSNWMAPGLLSGFFGLLLNGLVEANFSDTEIIILFGVIMGLTVVLWRVRQTNEKVHG